MSAEPVMLREAPPLVTEVQAAPDPAPAAAEDQGGEEQVADTEDTRPSPEDLACPHCRRNVGPRAFRAARQFLDKTYQARHDAALRQLAQEHAEVVEGLTAAAEARQAEMLAQATEEARRTLARSAPDAKRQTLVKAIRAASRIRHIEDQIAAARAGQPVRALPPEPTSAERLLDEDFPVYQLSHEERRTLIEAIGLAAYRQRLRRQALGHKRFRTR